MRKKFLYYLLILALVTVDVEETLIRRGIG